MEPEETIAQGQVLLQANELNFSYGTTTIVGGLSFGLKEGEFVSIVGRSGAGKSTLLKILAGLLPAGGHVNRNGRIRLVFQEGLLLPWFTVAGNIALGCKTKNRVLHAFKLMIGGGLLGFGRGDLASNQTEVMTLVRDIGMEGFGSRYPHELSGGERQRVAIARAFAGYPDIVLMDEPFGSLDVFTREKMQNWLLSFWDQHKASIVFVTHDVEEAVLLSDRVLVLQNGRLTFDLKVNFPRPRSAELKFREDFLAYRRRVSEALGIA